MANTDSPFGLKPTGIIYEPRKYKLTANYATAMGIGDPVIGVAAGTVQKAAAGTGNPVLGSVGGFLNASGLSVGYFSAAATGTWYVWVYDHPEQEFEIQEDGDTTPVALTDVFNTANFIFTHAANSTTGLSGVELDSSGAATATAAADQLRILAMVDSPDNAIGAYCKWVVKINNHFKLAGIVGVGV